MIKHYIIDGNNLIGKSKNLSALNSVNDSRSSLALILDRYFSGKKYSVMVHFDGYDSDPVKTSNVKLQYSGSRTADEEIKNEIMVAKNPKTICVISSDNNIIEFARVNSCKTIRSEIFAASLTNNENGSEEEKRIQSIDKEEIKRIFGV
ncbi:MAG: NYN domain-containing protein [Melioribacteraceae bacterium]|nr:NYN domain-containing protein [Melioribacteraceae bacterium]